MAEARVSECENQKIIISRLLKTPLKLKDTWCLVEYKWFKQWKKYVGYDEWNTSSIGEQSAYPGPIDNSGLMSETEPEMLKENLLDEIQFVLVPEEAWNILVSWYGQVEGQSPVARTVIEFGMFTAKQLRVEVYPTMIHMQYYDATAAEVESDDESQPTTYKRAFSREALIDDVEKYMRRMFNIADQKKVQLWIKHMSSTYEELINDIESTVQDAGLYQHVVIVIEVQNRDGTWPKDTGLQDMVRPSLGDGAVAGAGSEECVVCSHAVATVRFMPCGHQLVCPGCCVKMKKCVICKVAINKKIAPNGVIASDANPSGSGKGGNPSVEDLRAIIQGMEANMQGMEARMQEMEARIRSMEESLTCLICMERKRSVAFQCGHGACQQCTGVLNICHICRKPITRKINLFI